MKNTNILFVVWVGIIVISCTSDNNTRSLQNSQNGSTAKGPAMATTEFHRAVAVEELPHDPTAFTQGCSIVEGKWLESTGEIGKSRLQTADIQTGKVIQSVALPTNHFGEGSVRLGDSIYVLTWTNGICHVFDAATLQKKSEFLYSGEGWGLTTNGAQLLMSDGSNKIYLRNPATFAIEKTLFVFDRGTPIRNLNELEYIEGEIWANVWLTDSIVRIDTSTGAVKGWIDASGVLPRNNRPPSFDVLNGIAYDSLSKHIYLTGKHWDKIFRIKLQ